MPSVHLAVLSAQVARTARWAILLVNGRSAVRIRSPAPRGFHTSPVLMFTSGSDSWLRVCERALLTLASAVVVGFWPLAARR